MAEKTLVPTKQYLQTGSHIGARFKTGGMKKYIFKKRRDGLNVMDVETIDKKIRTTASFLSQYEPESIVVVSKKQYGQVPVKKFAEATGAQKILGRFIPGTFTNPEGKKFVEPKVLLATDPGSDWQAIKEAVKIRIPVVALCKTDNSTKNIDIVLPINNNGRQSLALAYWLLAREFLKSKKLIKKDSDFKENVESFEYPVQGEKQKEKTYPEKAVKTA